MAVRLQKPLFLHCRDAFDQFIAVLDKHLPSAATTTATATATATATTTTTTATATKPKAPPVCVHCFTGSEQELKEFIRRDYYIGVTGYVSAHHNTQHAQYTYALFGFLLSDQLMEWCVRGWLVAGGYEVAWRRVSKVCAFDSTQPTYD